MLELRKMNEKDALEQWKFVSALPADENGFTDALKAGAGHTGYSIKKA